MKMKNEPVNEISIKFKNGESIHMSTPFDRNVSLSAISDGIGAILENAGYDLNEIPVCCNKDRKIDEIDKYNEYWGNEANKNIAIVEKESWAIEEMLDTKYKRTSVDRKVPSSKLSFDPNTGYLLEKLPGFVPIPVQYHNTYEELVGLLDSGTNMLTVNDAAAIATNYIADRDRDILSYKLDNCKKK